MQNAQRNVIFSVIGYVLPLLAALATIPIMVMKLGVDLYGLYVIGTSLIGFMTLVDLGVGQSVIKYVSAYEVSGEHHKVEPVLGVALLVYLVIGLLSVLALYVFAPVIANALYAASEKRVLAEEVLRITALPLFFSYINQFFLNVCKAYHRFDVPAVIHNAGNLGGIVLATLLLLLGYSLVTVMWGYVLIQALAFVAGYVFSLRILPRGIRFFPYFHRLIFEEIVSFSFYTFVGNFVSSVAYRADKLLIGMVIGTETVTYYQIPFTIAQMANGIIHTLVHIAFPRFTELFTLHKHSALLALYQKVSDIMFLISMVIAVLLITVGGAFLSLWISPEFAQQSTLTLQIIAVFFFLHSNTVTGYWVLQSGGQAKLTALIAVIGTIAYFVGVYQLGSAYAHNGVALALFLLLLATPLQYGWIAKHVGQYYADYWVRLLFFGLLAYVLIYLLTHLNLWLNHTMWEIIVSSLLMLPLLVFGVAKLLAERHVPKQSGG